MSIKRISDFKFIVKNISMSPVSSQSPSVRKKTQMISSGDCMLSAKNPLLGLEKNKKNHHHQLLEIEKKKEGCQRLRPQVKYSTWDEIHRKTKRMDYDEDRPTKQHVPLLPAQELTHSVVVKGSSSVFKGFSSTVLKTSSSPSAFNLKGKAPLVMNSSHNNAKTEGFKSLKMHQGHDDDSAMNSSTAKSKKTVNVVPRKSATGHHQAAVPVLVRRKSNQHDSDSRNMQFNGNKAFIFPHKRPRNHDDDDDEKSALNLKRRKATLTSSGAKPNPAESLETSPASSCQTVVSSSCRLRKNGVDSVNNSSDASSVINVPADEQQKAVFKNAVHSSTIGETSDNNSSPQDDDCGISPIIDEDTRKRWLATSHWKTLARITRTGELPGSPWRR